MYGLSWIVLAAQIACCTWTGESAGAAAVPSGSKWAAVPGTVIWAGVATGAGVPGGKTAPPLGPPVGAGACARAADGRTSMSDVRSAGANARRENKPYSSFVG